MALADRGEKLHSETPISLFLLNIFSIDLCNYKSSVHLQEDLPNISDKPRNQGINQQLCANFWSRGQFWCVDGLKSASPRALGMPIG